jgi:hypothetical protein
MSGTRSLTLVDGHSPNQADAPIVADWANGLGKNLVPVSGYVMVGGIWVPATATASGTLIANDNDHTTLDVALATGRASPGVEVLWRGASVAGRTLTVWQLSGSMVLRLSVASAARTSLAAALYGTLQFINATSKIVRTVGAWDDVSPAADDYSQPGTLITITGSGLNDGSYVVVGLGANAQELVVNGPLVNEGPIPPVPSPVVTGVWPTHRYPLQAMNWPNMIRIDEEFTKIFVENQVQMNCAAILVVGRRL